jgi:hypothetical protein
MQLGKFEVAQWCSTSPGAAPACRVVHPHKPLQVVFEKRKHTSSKATNRRRDHNTTIIHDTSSITIACIENFTKYNHRGASDNDASKNKPIIIRIGPVVLAVRFHIQFYPSTVWSISNYDVAQSRESINRSNDEFITASQRKGFTLAKLFH